jgi:hypothetical protein
MTDLSEKKWEMKREKMRIMLKYVSPSESLLFVFFRSQMKMDTNNKYQNSVSIDR